MQTGEYHFIMNSITLLGFSGRGVLEEANDVWWESDTQGLFFRRHAHDDTGSKSLTTMS